MPIPTAVVARNPHANPLLSPSLTTSIRTPIYFPTPSYASTLINPPPHTKTSHILGRPVQHDTGLGLGSAAEAAVSVWDGGGGTGGGEP